MTLYKSKGTLRYSDGWLVVDADQQLADYYRSLIPKYACVNRPRWAAHITLVRRDKESPVYIDNWGKYEGLAINFLYDPTVQSGKIYYWLNIYCKMLEEIRLELGLPVVSQYTLPPDGFRKCFHMTVANCKV